MSRLILSLLFAGLFAFSCCMVIDEPCRKDAYPPKASTKIPTMVLNLDLPPQERWAHIVGPKKQQLQDLMKVIKELVPAKILNLVEAGMQAILTWLPDPYSGEIQGIADATGLPVGEAVLYNIFYEIFTVCTSIVGHDKNGTMYHARNLDFGLFMGWDDKNNTWAISERLRELMVNVDYQKDGKTVFKAIHFVGYVGILTAVKKDKFTLTMNERFSLDGGYIGIFEWLIGASKGQWMGFLTRDTMQKADSFEQARDMLSKTELLAPAYFILGGLHPGEEAVVTRDREKTADLWTTDLKKGEWFLLETNYDHWKSPLVIDDRRTPGYKCMNEMGQAGMGLAGLFNVLSTRSVLNKLTTYTALMQVNAGSLDSYIQQCPDPCWPW